MKSSSLILPTMATAGKRARDDDALDGDYSIRPLLANLPEESEANGACMPAT